MTAESYTQYVCITSNHRDTESNSDPNLNPNPISKQHAIANIELSVVIMSYVSREIHVVAPFLLTFHYHCHPASYIREQYAIICVFWCVVLGGNEGDGWQRTTDTATVAPCTVSVAMYRWSRKK